MPDHVIEQGECFASVAVRYGFAWRTLWDHPSNAELKKKRRDPNVLAPGDVVFLPAKEAHEESCATGKMHRFVFRGFTEVLRIRLLDELDRPRSQLDYEIVIDGERRRGQTNKDGVLHEPIHPKCTEATLLFSRGEEEFEIALRLGHLDPLESVSGAQGRLASLSFDPGPSDGVHGPRTSDALREFQEAFGLEPTGELEAKTMDTLKTRHGR